MTDLFSPLQAGELALPNRILMAPLTRCRADDGRGGAASVFKITGIVLHR